MVWEEMIRMWRKFSSSNHNCWRSCDSEARMEQLPDDSLHLTLVGNEHAALCCRRFRRIIVENLLILRWIRVLLFGDRAVIKCLTFEGLYRHVYAECLAKRQNVVAMAFHVGMREFSMRRMRRSRGALDVRARLVMVADILMYWNNSRPTHTACLHRIIQRRTGVHMECRCCR